MITDYFSDFLQDGFENILSFLYDRALYIFDVFITFVFGLFDVAGGRVVLTGQVLSNHFESNKLLSVSNFPTVFIGFIFTFWAIKTAYKLVMKLIDIVGNFTPLT